MGITIVVMGASATLVAPPAGLGVLQAHDSSGPVIEETKLSPTALPNRFDQKARSGAARAREIRARGVRFLVAPGESGRSGPGKLQTFRVEIESGIKGISPHQFAADVEAQLMDHRSWGHKDGRSLKRVSTGKSDFRVTLTKSGTVDRMCYPLTTNGIVSCFTDGRAIINLRRWRQGAPDFSSLEKYRTYLINHEVGHGLGKSHWFCPPTGGAGKLMMQQTYMTSDKCSPERFPRPDAPKFKSKCTLAMRQRAGWLFLEGQVSVTPKEQRVTLEVSNGEHSSPLGTVNTTTNGNFLVPIAPGSLDPNAQSISMRFDGSRDLSGCQDNEPILPGT